MVETKNPEEPTLPSKRKSDVSCEDHPSKAPKLQSLNNNSQLPEDKTQEPDEKLVNSDAQLDENGDDGENDDEKDNGEVVVDRKGKGILVEENDGDDDSSDDDDDDEDSSDGWNQSEDESDLSDDPLAEVDLDNILPSRTRRRVIRPGEFVVNDLADDDSDSDDDDA